MKQRSTDQETTPRIESAKQLLDSFKQLEVLKQKVEEGKLGVIQPGGILSLMFQYLSHRKHSPLQQLRQNDALECLGVLLDAFEEGTEDNISHNWESGKVQRDIVRKSDRKVVDSKDETMITWNLQIPEASSSAPLSRCFMETFDSNEETITYQREGDSEPTEYVLKRRVKETPRLFFMSMIRWDMNQNKKMTPVEVPLQFSIQEVMYQLRGVICHMGSTIPSGHYYSVVIREDKAYRIDDDSIQPCPLPFPEPIKRHIYGIMYERKQSDTQAIP